MRIRKVNEPQMNGHKYTLIITKEGDYPGCKIPLVIVGNKLQVRGIKTDSDCAKNEEDIKKLIAHINIELDNRDGKDMFSSMQELEDFLTLQIKTFCPAGIYKSIHEGSETTPPPIPSKRIKSKSNSSILKNPISAQSSINTIMTRSPNVSLPTRLSLSSEQMSIMRNTPIPEKNDSNKKLIDAITQIKLNLMKNLKLFLILLYCLLKMKMKWIFFLIRWIMNLIKILKIKK